jgi:hypothetical protein
MTSQKKIQANQRNAMKSTGPKTPQGKARVSENAVVHGLTSQKVLLRGEDAAEHERLREEAVAYYQPKGAMEERAVDRIVAYEWRIDRVDRIEGAVFNRLVTREVGHRAFEVESKGIVIGEKLHMFDEEVEAMIFKEAKNIEATSEDIESALAASVMEPDAMKTSRQIDARRQSEYRGLARCQKELEVMQKCRREREEMKLWSEPPLPIPFRNPQRRNIAQDD